VSDVGQLLFDPALLFRLQLRPCATSLKFGERDWQLPQQAELPDLGSSLSGQPAFAKIRMAQSDSGLFLNLQVRGKRQLAWCRESRVEDSDGLHLWLDARNSRDVHRATRYCYRFVFAPLGRGPRADQPFAGWAPINRAREHSPPPPEKLLLVQAKIVPQGYDLWASLSWQALKGFDKNDFPVLGFYCAVIDRELGWQSLGLGPQYPVAEDPSLWCELALS